MCIRDSVHYSFQFPKHTLVFFNRRVQSPQSVSCHHWAYKPIFWLKKFTCSFRAAVCILVGNLFRLQKIKLPRSFGSEPILERLVAFAILSHFDCIFARNQSNRTIFDPPNKPGWIINAYQIKQYGMVQNSPKPSHHIATDENCKIRNRRSCL